MPVEYRGEVAADRRPQPIVGPLARDEHQHRHEPVEPVAPRQHPHARPFVELQHRRREREQRVLVDLEQFVARIGVENIRQRLAGMAVRQQAGARLDRRDLVAQIRDRPRRARISRRGEQADDAQFAGELTLRIETFEADVIEMHAAVHARARIRLGDDQKLRLLEERHDLRRDFQLLVATAQHIHALVAQNAKPGAGNALQPVAIAGERIVTRAEKREVVGQQPFDELNRLGDFRDRQRRRLVLELRHRLPDARLHRAPVDNRDAYLAEHDFKRRGNGRTPRRIGHRIDVDINEALACRAVDGAGTAKRGELAAAIAIDGEHGMRDEAHRQTLRRQLGHHRVDQERHVVVDDLDDADRPALARRRGRERLLVEPDRRVARSALREERPRLLRELRELLRLIAQQIFRRRAAEQ